MVIAASLDSGKTGDGACGVKRGPRTAGLDSSRSLLGGLALALVCGHRPEENWWAARLGIGSEMAGFGDDFYFFVLLEVDSLPPEGDLK